MEGNTTKREDLRKEMFSMVERWESSGLTQADFCARAGISPARFAYWRGRFLRQSSADSGFSEVMPLGDAGLEVVFPGGVVLRCRGEVDVRLLRALCLG